nr:flagellin [Oceanobacillus halophilus]
MISLIQTAEGALNETHSILQRMRELAVQSSNDTNNDEEDRKALQDEMNQLSEEITRIADNTEFNTKNLLDGEFKGTFHVGANAQQNLTISIDAMDASTLGVTGTRTGLSEDATAEVLGKGSQTVLKDDDGNQFAVKVGDDYYKLSDVRLNSAGSDLEAKTSAEPLTVSADPDDDTKFQIEGDTAGIDISTQEMANGAITSIQTAIDTVSSERSKLGAVQNRLDHTINNLGTSAENLTAAESRIRDVDYDLAA